MPRLFACVARPVFFYELREALTAAGKSSGRHAGIYGADFSALGLVVVTLALHAHVGVDYIDIAFGYCAYRALGQADPACHTIVGNFQCHGYHHLP